MKTYVNIELFYQLDEAKNYLSFGYFTLWIEDVYQVNHFLSVTEAEKELRKLREKLGKEPTESIEEGDVRYVKLGGYLD